MAEWIDMVDMSVKQEGFLGKLPFRGYSPLVSQEMLSPGSEIMGNIPVYYYVLQNGLYVVSPWDMGRDYGDRLWFPSNNSFGFVIHDEDIILDREGRVTLTSLGYVNVVGGWALETEFTYQTKQGSVQLECITEGRDGGSSNAVRGFLPNEIHDISWETTHDYGDLKTTILQKGRYPSAIRL